MVQGVKDVELLQKLHVGIVVHAPDTRVIFLNDRASELLGITKEGMLGSVNLASGWALLHEDGRLLSPDAYPVNRVVASGQALIDEVLGVKRQGHEEIVWAAVSGFPVFDATGCLEKVVISFYDVSQLKRTEVVLKEQAEQLRFVLEGADLGFWDWNVRTGTVMRNERWAKMLGYTHAEIENTTMQWSDFVHPDDRERAWASINAVLEGRAATHKLEYRMRHKDGCYRWILDQANVTQRDEHGRPVRMCGTHADVTERKLLEEEVTRQARTDYLTGVFNRRHFMTLGSTEIERARRYGSELSLLMLDIDFFKRINDRYGHRTGDSVLKKLTELCQVGLRSLDVFGRLGGEEFAILLPETDQTAAAEVAERLRLIVSEARVPTDVGPAVSFTVSMGVSSMSPTTEGIDDLLSAADRAMYEAKHAGRNMVRLATQCAAPPLQGS